MKILVYEPQQRLSPRRILAHPFFDELRKDDTFLPRGYAEPIKLPNLFDFNDFELQILGEFADKIKPEEIIE